MLAFGVRLYVSFKYGRQIKISRRVEILVPFSTRLEFNDSHGGFHGDGERLFKVYFSKEQAEKFKEKIEKNIHWKKLPMPELLQDKVSFETEEGMNMPIIENGYFFFLDRHSLAEDKYSSDKIDDKIRSSWNYTVAVFDTDENILYFYELDT
jgi:hypothetical protein